MLALVVLVQSLVLLAIVVWMWRHRTEHKQQYQLAILEATNWAVKHNARDLEILSIVKNWEFTHPWISQGDCEKLRRLVQLGKESKYDSQPRTFAVSLEYDSSQHSQPVIHSPPKHVPLSDE